MTRLLSVSFWFMVIGAIGTVLFFLNQNRVDEWVKNPLLSGAITYGPLLIFGSGAILSRLGIRGSKKLENENAELRNLKKEFEKEKRKFTERCNVLEQQIKQMNVGTIDLKKVSDIGLHSD